MIRNAVIAVIPCYYGKDYLVIHSPKTGRWGFPGAFVKKDESPISGLIRIANDLGGFEIKSAIFEMSVDHLYTDKIGSMIYYKLELLNVEDVQALVLSGDRLQDFLNPFEILCIPNLVRHTRFFCNQYIYS